MLLLSSTSWNFKVMALITLQSVVLQSFQWQLLLFGLCNLHNAFVFHKQNFLVPFYWQVYNASRQHYRETFYFQLLSRSTLDRWTALSTMKSCCGFKPQNPRLAIPCPNYKAIFSSKSILDLFKSRLIYLPEDIQSR